MTSPDNDRTYLPNSRACFACGEENIAGLQLRFFVEDGKIKTWFQPKPHHCGYPNVLHGGVVAALLDETIAWAANRALARMTVTAELKLRYRKPVPGDRRMLVWAEITKSARRIAYGTGAIVDETGGIRPRRGFHPAVRRTDLAIDDHHLPWRRSVFDMLRNGP